MLNLNKFSLFDIVNLSTILVSSIVLVGWFSRNEYLIQVSPSFAPMQFNTALCFVILGVISFFKCRESLIKNILTVTLTLFTLFTLSQYVLGINLGIDELFFDHYIDTNTSHPGRMAPNSALCFIFFGFVLFFRTSVSVTNKYIRWILLLFIYLLTFIPLVGYLLQIKSAYGWFQYTGMAIHTAFLFFLNLCAQILCTFLQMKKKDTSFYIWSSSLVIGLSISVVVGLLFRVDLEERKLANEKQNEKYLQKEIKSRIQSEMRNILYLASYLENSKLESQFENDSPFVTCINFELNRDGSNKCLRELNIVDTLRINNNFFNIKGLSLLSFKRNSLGNLLVLEYQNQETKKESQFVIDLNNFIVDLMNNFSSQKVEILILDEASLKKNKSTLKLYSLSSEHELAFRVQTDQELKERYPELITLILSLLSLFFSLCIYLITKAKRVSNAYREKISAKNNQLVDFSHKIDTSVNRVKYLYSEMSNTDDKVLRIQLEKEIELSLAKLHSSIHIEKVDENEK